MHPGIQRECQAGPEYFLCDDRRAVRDGEERERLQAWPKVHPDILHHRTSIAQINEAIETALWQRGRHASVAASGRGGLVQRCGITVSVVIGTTAAVRWR